MTNAIGYCRVSGLSQVNEGDGLGVQRERIAAWCTYQGITLMTVHEDAGISGAATENRPGLRSALRAALEAGHGSVLVVYKLDRLGRNAIDVQEVLAVLLDAGVRVVALADGVDSASGMGSALLKLLTSILATFAELERESIRTRLLDGRRRADAENRVYSREPRYGRRRAESDPRQLVEDQDEQRLVVRVRQLRGEGLSYRAICAALEAEGLHPRRAAAWSPAVIGRLITGRRAPAKSSKSGRIVRVRAELLADPC
jgi:DNA invertase Pin-like site-specific DNA recombinase